MAKLAPFRFLAIASAFVLVMLLQPGSAFAAPVNDDFASATIIDPSALPFSDSVVIDDATLESGETGCYLTGKSVWYSITPTARVYCGRTSVAALSATAFSGSTDRTGLGSAA